MLRLPKSTNRNLSYQIDEIVELKGFPAVMAMDLRLRSLHQANLLDACTDEYSTAGRGRSITSLGVLGPMELGYVFRLGTGLALNAHRPYMSDTSKTGVFVPPALECS